ncbi:MAG: class I tRNA ligase family protein, partial [Proteobacteria bacterium]|nr:class I tRNA ligase family protein [Pseudomonadota bacterium]
ARALFGAVFDIHGGGLDLQFPHHENEIAQSCACSGESKMANVWMHNEMLQVEGRKMSKSLGNFFTVRDLLERGYHGAVIRYVYLMTHYRKPMDWSDAKAEEAEAKLKNWQIMASTSTTSEVCPSILEALSDDLNTPLALHHMDKLRNKIAHGENLFAQLKWGLEILGLSEYEEAEQIGIDEDDEKFIELLAENRQKAREDGNFEEADTIRDKLGHVGIILEDVKGTSSSKKTPPKAKDESKKTRGWESAKHTKTASGKGDGWEVVRHAKAVSGKDSKQKINIYKKADSGKNSGWEIDHKTPSNKWRTTPNFTKEKLTTFKKDYIKKGKR